MRRRDVLLTAACFGLLTGLVEGALFLIFQFHGGSYDVPPEILAVTPTFDLMLFMGLAAVFLIGIGLGVPVSFALIVGVFAFVAALDWVTIPLASRLHHYALVLLALGIAAQVGRWSGRHREAVLESLRRSLAWLAGLALAALLFTVGGGWVREALAVAHLPPTAPGTPNVLVVVIDTLRADHLSSYGYARTTSPALDRIARSGVLFEQAIAASSYTLPSHASLLTGRWLHEHGAEWRRGALPAGPYPTLPEVLRARGYRTAAFSANLFWFTRTQGFGRGFIHFEDYFHSLADMGWRTLYGRTADKLVRPWLGFDDLPARKRAPDITRAALQWIGRDRTRPFFAFLNYLDTHDPYLPPAPYRGMFARVPNPGGLLNDYRRRTAPPRTPEELQGEIDAYDGAIAYIDHHVGALLAGLPAGGRDTLIVITSDHGESFGEHGLFLHRYSLYRPEIQVPLIICWSGHVPADVRVPRPVSNVAIAATIMELLGAESPFPGPPLSRLWTVPGADGTWPYPLAELEHKPWMRPELPVAQGSIKSLVTPQWHFVLHQHHGGELYDWAEDAREERNLSSVAAVAPVVADLQAQLGRVPWADSSACTRAGAPPVGGR